MANQNLSAQAAKGKAKKTTRKCGIRNGMPKNILNDMPEDIPEDITNPEDIAGAQEWKELTEYIKLAERVSHVAIWATTQHRNWLEKHKVQIAELKRFIHDDVFMLLKDLTAHVDTLTEKVDALTAKKQ